ncbi:hypothetical protein [Alienimonas chondri]|uniref:Outer membrane protein TolC n=1 Tax=Alienimonas chondri TaxID=2681879 RepID=A0ABX1VD06_9PLAN|nr:hypothetical protein [Alienimonas chondri]NNJ25777.1 hypothetical protein [Alienimonas chondri]
MFASAASPCRVMLAPALVGLALSGGGPAVLNGAPAAWAMPQDRSMWANKPLPSAIEAESAQLAAARLEAYVSESERLRDHVAAVMQEVAAAEAQQEAATQGKLDVLEGGARPAAEVAVQRERQRLAVSQWASRDFAPVRDVSQTSPEILKQADGRTFGPRVVVGPAEEPYAVTRLRTVREQFASRLNAGSPLANGAIVSGRALNYYLDLLGPSASEHLFLLNGLQAAPGDDPVDREVREEVARTLTDDVGINPRALTRVNFAKVGLKGAAVMTSLTSENGVIRETVLPPTWSRTLRLGFGPQLARVDEARDRALNADPRDPGVDDALFRLMKAVDDLQYEVQKAISFQRVVRLGDAAAAAQVGVTGVPAGRWGPLTVRDLKEAEREVLSLRYAVGRYANSSMGNRQTEGTLDSAIHLVAHMHASGLEFQECSDDPEDQLIYRQLYDGLRAYYRNLVTLQAAARDDAALAAAQSTLAAVDAEIAATQNRQDSERADRLAWRRLIAEDEADRAELARQDLAVIERDGHAQDLPSHLRARYAGEAQLEELRNVGRAIDAAGEVLSQPDQHFDYGPDYVPES